MKTDDVRVEVPVVLASLQQYMYDNLPTEEQGREWSKAFVWAIKLGTDLSSAWRQYAAWMLDDPTNGVVSLATTRGARKAIRAIATLYREGCTDEQRWQTAADAAQKVEARANSFFTGHLSFATIDGLDAAMVAADAARFAAKAVRVSQNLSAADLADSLSAGCAVDAVNSAIFAFGHEGHGQVNSPACKRAITRHSEKLLAVLLAA